MKLIKYFFVLVLFALMLPSQWGFAARGVDYQGVGNPAIVNEDSSGLQLRSGQSLILGNGQTLTTGNAGNFAVPGSISSYSSGVTYGNLTITSGSILLTSGNATLTSGNLILTSGYIQDPSGTWYISGTATTRDAARLSTYGQSAPVGSTYRSTAGKMYLKVGNSNVTSDYQRVSTTASD